MEYAASVRALASRSKNVSPPVWINIDSIHVSTFPPSLSQKRGLFCFQQTTMVIRLRLLGLSLKGGNYPRPLFFNMGSITPVLSKVNPFEEGFFWNSGKLNRWTTHLVLRPFIGPWAGGWRKSEGELGSLRVSSRNGWRYPVPRFVKWRKGHNDQRSLRSVYSRTF